MQLQKALIQKNPKQSQPTLTQGGDGHAKGAISSIITSQCSAKNNSALDYASEFLSIDMRKPKKPFRGMGGTGTWVNPIRSRTR